MFVIKSRSVAADLAQMVLTKCVRPEGNIRSDSFHLQLNFEFVQDMEESRRVSKRRSLTAAMQAASSSLLDPKERCALMYVHTYTHTHFYEYYLAYRIAEFEFQCYPVIRVYVVFLCYSAMFFLILFLVHDGLQTFTERTTMCWLLW